MTPLILAALLAGPAPKVDVVAGGAAILGTASDTHVKPFARVLTDWYLAGNTRALVASVQAEFTGLPDAQVTLGDAGEFDAVQVRLQLAYQPSVNVFASGFCEGGFASRIEGDVPAKTSAPLWGSCGVWFRDRGKHRGRLTVGLGPDERLGWGWTMAAHVDGSVRIAQVGETDLGPTLYVSAILGLETPQGQEQRVNIITAGVGLSWGN